MVFTDHFNGSMLLPRSIVNFNAANRSFRCCTDDWNTLLSYRERCFNDAQQFPLYFFNIDFHHVYIELYDDANMYVRHDNDIGSTNLQNSFNQIFIPFTVPLQLPIVAREHFNRWYSRRAYYCALTFTDFPLQFICVFVYIVITYLMTAQPLESFRLGFVLSITLMLSLISQAIGIIFGAAFGVRVRSSFSYKSAMIEIFCIKFIFIKKILFAI